MFLAKNTCIYIAPKINWSNLAAILSRHLGFEQTKKHVSRLKLLEIHYLGSDTYMYMQVF
jgi:hypothetical protein